jgi:hypothetical protein
MLTCIERFRLTTNLIPGLTAGVVVALVFGLNSSITLPHMEAKLARICDSNNAMPLSAQTKGRIPGMRDMSNNPLPTQTERQQCVSIALRQQASMGEQA